MALCTLIGEGDAGMVPKQLVILSWLEYWVDIYGEETHDINIT